MFIGITIFVGMKNKEVIFKRLVYHRIIPKRCPVHHKQAHISVSRMECRITEYCCEEFREHLKSLCCKYKYGVLSGRYDFFPRSRLK